MPELAAVGRDYRFDSGQSAGSAVGRTLGRALGRAFRQGRKDAFGSGAGAGRKADRGMPTRRPMARGTAATLAALAIAAIAIGAIAAALSSIGIRSVSVSGAIGLGEAEVRSLAGLGSEGSWLSADPEAIAAALMADPRIASAEVRRGFPGSFEVAIAERTPIAVVYARGGDGRIAAHCVDASGTVFGPASGYPGAGSLPVLSGLEIRGLHYGLRLDGAFLSALGSLAALAADEPALAAAISELRLVSREGVPAELLIYPAGHRVPVRARPAFGPGLLKSAMLVLDVVEGEGISGSIRELDARTGTFVYRTKEAAPGR